MKNEVDFSPSLEKYHNWLFMLYWTSICIYFWFLELNLKVYLDTVSVLLVVPLKWPKLPIWQGYLFPPLFEKLKIKVIGHLLFENNVWVFWISNLDGKYWACKTQLEKEIILKMFYSFFLYPYYHYFHIAKIFTQHFRIRLLSTHLNRYFKYHIGVGYV